MKRLFSFFMAISLGVILIGCTTGNLFVAESTEQESVIAEFSALNDIKTNQPNIYMIVKVVSTGYWQSMVKAAQIAGDDLGCNIFWGGTDNETDWKGQRILIQEAIDKEADAIILAPDDSVKLVEDIEQAKAKGIAVILVDTIVNSDKYDVCYMTENFIAGKNAAQEMLAQLKQKGHADSESLSIGIIVGNANSQTINERLAGFYLYWNNNAPEKWTIERDIMNPDGDVVLGKHLVTDFITTKDVAGIYGTNNGPSQAIARAVLETEDKSIVVVGFDYSDEMKTLVESEEYTASSVVQQQYNMSYKAVESAKKLIAGEAVKEKFVDTGIVIVNHENYKDSDIQKILERN